MKYAFTNGIIIDGSSKDMEPVRGRTVLTDGEKITGFLEGARSPKDTRKWTLREHIFFRGSSTCTCILLPAGNLPKETKSRQTTRSSSTS